MKLFKAEQFTDERGVIINATPMNPKIRNVMYITGRRGAIRGSHYHKEDTHYSLVVAGTIRYKHKKMGSRKNVGYIDLHPGDIVLSERGEWHQFEFLTDGVFVAMATKARDHDLYEQDTTRVDM